MNEVNNDLNIQEIRELLKSVKYREKELTQEFELLEQEQNENNVQLLAQASVSDDQMTKFLSLVTQHIQKTEPIIKKNVSELLKSKSPVKKSLAYIPTKSSFRRSKQGVSEQCISEKKAINTKLEKQLNNSPKKQTNETPKFTPRSSRTKPTISQIKLSPFPKFTPSVLKDNVEIVNEEPKVLPNVVVLGVVQTKRQQIKTESKETNTPTKEKHHTNSSVQTVEIAEVTSKSKLSVGIQTNANTNFKIIEVKPSQSCDIQILPNININPTPKVNNRYIEVVHEESHNQIQDKSVKEESSKFKEESSKFKEESYMFKEESSEFKDESSEFKEESSKFKEEYSLEFEEPQRLSAMTSHSIENLNTEAADLLTFTEDRSQAVMFSVDLGGDRSSTAASIRFDPLTSPDRPISAPHILLPATKSTKEAAIQTSTFSSSSSELLRSSSCPDIKQLSLGEIVPSNNSQNEGYSSSYILSEGEIPPRLLRQKADLKPNVKFREPQSEELTSDSGKSEGEIS